MCCSVLRALKSWYDSKSLGLFFNMHTATRCNTLGPNLTEIMIIYIYCNTVQHIATRCNALQHTVQVFRAKPHKDYAHPNILQHTVTHGNILQQPYNTLCRNLGPNLTETMLIHVYCNILQHIATHCNNTATHCAGIRVPTSRRLCSYFSAVPFLLPVVGW